MSIYSSNYANVNVIRLVVTSAGTPQPLGEFSQMFKGVIFQGYHWDSGSGFLVPNAQTVFVQVRALGANGELGDWQDAIPVPVEGYSPGINVSSEGSRWFNAAQFRVRVQTDGDGVSAIPMS